MGHKCGILRADDSPQTTLRLRRHLPVTAEQTLVISMILVLALMAGPLYLAIKGGNAPDPD